MIIDAHQHYWDNARGDYGWLTPALPEYWRPFGPADLTPHLAAHGVGGTIVVQAAPTEAETDYLLALATRNASIRGVVGWVDLESPAAETAIRRRAAVPVFVGLRPMLQDLDDPAWILRERVLAALAVVADTNLVFDALVRVPQVASIMIAADQLPQMTIVLDHAAKPEIARQERVIWRDAMTQLARRPNVYCKLSGLLNEARSGATVDDLRFYSDVLLEVFGPDRLIWGSDWPVLTSVASYGDWMEMSKALLNDVSAEQRSAIFGENAQRVYRLGAK